MIAAGDCLVGIISLEDLLKSLDLKLELEGGDSIPCRESPGSMS
jgi:hypothetical protein